MRPLLISQVNQTDSVHCGADRPESLPTHVRGHFIVSVKVARPRFLIWDQRSTL